jgi:hypothetical protein
MKINLDFNFHNVEQYWMHLDRVLQEKLVQIQQQGEGWKDGSAFIHDGQARDDFVTQRWIELVAELAAASQLIRLMGYPQAADQGEVLLRMAKIGDVREHKVREAINTFHHQFHPEQGKYLVT